MHTRTVTSFDGVPIAYSVSGDADTALVFIHGGMADKSFWDGQHAPFAGQHRVIAVDLAGHGESGRKRHEWGIVPFARDAVATITAERVTRAIAIGNSLGGPVAIEAAVLLGDAAKGVVGVDTFQDMGRRIDPEWARARADAWRRDPDCSLDEMLRALFHPDAPTALVADLRARMRKTPPDVVADMFAAFGGYDTAASARLLRIPVRSINGDLFPTDIDAVRRTIADFDAVVLPHTGHYPMLERPEEFNRHLANCLAGMI